jgi:hypothetical protein
MATTLSSTTLESAHLSLVSVVVILIVLLFMTEIGGLNQTAADAMLIILVAALLMRGMAENGYFAELLANYPWVP